MHNAKTISFFAGGKIAMLSFLLLTVSTLSATDIYLQGTDGGSETSFENGSVLLNKGAELACELEDMPSDYKLGGGKSLHVTGIPADELSHEPVVVKLEFKK